MSNEQQVCQNFKFISINSNLTNLATIEYNGKEVKIGNNLYKKLLIFEGIATSWTTVGNAPSNSNARIDFGNSYAYYPSDNFIYPLSSKALGTMVRIFLTSGEVQIICENNITIRAIISIIYNK